jgi:predicted nucleic acid-binding protein
VTLVDTSVWVDHLRHGWIDAHLLASASLAGTPLWTRDTRLRTVARRLGVAADAS